MARRESAAGSPPRRHAVRVIILDACGGALLIMARDARDGHTYWCVVGGGISAAEDLPTAAAREVLEETGLHLLENGRSLRRDALRIGSPGEPTSLFDETYVAGRVAASEPARPAALEGGRERVLKVAWRNGEAVRRSRATVFPADSAELIKQVAYDLDQRSSREPYPASVGMRTR